MIYLIFGENIFFAKKKIKKIIEERKKFFGEKLAIYRLEGKSLDFTKVKDNISNKTLFGQRNIIIISSAFKNQDFKEKFLKEGKELIASETIIIFFEEGKINKDDPLFKFIKKEGQIYEFPALTTYQIKKIIEEELSKKGFKIEPSAKDLLIEFTQKDLWDLSSQLNKLMAYKAKERFIKKEDISLLVKPQIEVDIFKTIDALAQKNKKKALEFIYKHLKRGESPLYLLTMIRFQFKNLLIVKEKDRRKISSLTQLRKELSDIHPFILEKSFWQAKKFSLDQLKNFYRKIFKIDLAIKKGKVDPQEGLELLILDL
jgi:DNA polymerase-3 subunit delta